ncbi:MAG: hypothetical protein M3010_02930 [Candidatus Dormibacteraeota bacterium]|nr:hypothetical protein [Candidatus Dormibacteraeota bacterium]
MSRHGGLLVQGSSGHKGNFEVGVARLGGGFWQFWRDNDSPTLQWHGPDLAMGTEGQVFDVGLVADRLAPEQLVAVRREGNELRCSTRGHVNVHGVVRPRWGASQTLPGGGVCSGVAGFIQSVDQGNFEVVAPLASGGLGHWWRDNGVPARPWHGPAHITPGTFSACGLIQSDGGHLEVVALRGGELLHFWRDPMHIWHGPTAIASHGVSGQPGFIQAHDGARAGV